MTFMKIMLIGDSGVGKTQLFLRFYDGFFLPTYTVTSGADYRTKEIVVDDIEVKIDTWDAVNQKHSDVVTLNYLHAMGILLVYDVTDKKSFYNTKKWVAYIKQYVCEGVNVILIGNKCDEVENKVITKEQGQTLADEFKFKFLETSAKSNVNVEEAFCTLVRDIKKILIDPYRFEPEPIIKENKKSFSTLARDFKEMLIGSNQVERSADNIFYDGLR
ncbi:ras-domain-containing protein [Gigaspora margarita]|uniref:Ras-domain-containing protein n=1 Tax=Gigaspora margarita TaxID=4874 RepID=A0A8H3XBS8_GIGMA|nr:ras-domain-containing protein [Gigaspora margarita]